MEATIVTPVTSRTTSIKKSWAFSLATANRCAKSYLENELGQDVDEDDEMDDKEDDKEDDEEDLEEFFWDGSDEGIFDEDDCDAYNKVWVECHAIEDASTRFHP